MQRIQVDYFGSGRLWDAFHPTAKLPFIQGKIELPELSGNYSDIGQLFVVPFKLPTPIINPFLIVTGVSRGVDKHFIAINEQEGEWELHLTPQVSKFYISGVIEQRMRTYENPFTRVKYGDTVIVGHIVYGGFRG